MHNRLKNQPKYKIGHEVEVIIKTTDKISGLSFNNTVNAHISVIKATGDSESDTYEYGITTDMPGCYYSGKHPFMFIYEKDIKLTNNNDERID